MEPSRAQPGRLRTAALAAPLVLVLASLLAGQEPGIPDFSEVAPRSERPFTSIPALAALIVVASFGLLGAIRVLLPRTSAAPARWIRSVFAHALRIGWLTFVPALVLDGLIFFMGGRYSHAWTIGVLFFALAPFAAGLQWEKPWWNARKRREEAYVPAFNYFVGIALVVLIPALIFDAILSALADRGLLTAAAMPLNLLALVAVAGTAGFVVTWVIRLLLMAVLLPHRTALFFLGPQSRFYAVILTLSLGFMAAFNYMTLPAFFEVISAALPPRPAITADQAIVILLPNTIHLLCVTYFSIFAGSFISMLPIILFSKSLRKKAEMPPNLRELLDSPERSRAYLGRELREEDILPTIVTVTAYNEPPEPLEKTLFGYLKVAKRWIELGLPRDRYVILFSHQTEREEERAEFESFLAERFPGEDPLGLIDRDWSRFDEDNPNASIRSDARCREVLAAWLERKKLDPASKAGRSELQKRLVCQRMIEFSHHVPRQVLGMPDPPERTYANRAVGWVWYYLIPKVVGSRTLQMNSKAHNLYYAREGVWGKAATSPLARDGIFNEYEEWIYDASDADCEIHESCVAGILASYSPMYREPRLGWLQRLSYTIEPSATFLSAVKSASETAYWSWYLRARVHTYSRRGKPIKAMVGGVERPIRRDFQAANGHNLVVRGTSIREAGGDIEHEVANVHPIESPVARWLARLSGKPVPKERAVVERWVPTGEDLELATRMALEGYYGDYAVYAPQGEGSPADFRGNVPQAIRWSGNNVQLVFMHIAKVFTSPKLTFNEKMGYFVNLATLASAPLLYLTLLRSVIAPFLDIPDVYAAVHPGLGPLAFILALAPNFLLLSLALAGQLVVRPSEPWQRSVLNPSHRKFLQWIGYFTVPPLTILIAAFLPGWLLAAQVPVPEGVSWGLVIAAVNINLFLLIAKRDVYASLAYCIILLPFLQVLYLSWVIFGIIGCVNMLVKTQIVEPYISRLAGTSHPPVAGRYPSDGSGRFLAMTQRFPWLFAPIRFARQNAVGLGVLLATGVGIALWSNPPAGLPREAAAIAGFAALLLWLGRRLGPLLDDWFLDKDSLANRWWDYWTNPQPAFVKTLKEREERSLGTLVKDNVFGILNGLVVLGLILHVHFVNAADFSAALLAYLTFSIAASWIISPFFYEEPHRKLRSQGKAALFAVLAVAACVAVPLGALDPLQSALGIRPVPAEVLPWLQLLLGAIAVGALVNVAPWAGLRAFAKRFALASIMIGLLFLNALAISYRGISITPLFESWALEADRAYGAEVRREAMDRARADDLEVDAEEAERAATLTLLEERMAADWLEVLEERVPPARKGLDLAAKRRDLAQKRLELEASRSELPEKLEALELAEGDARSAALATILEWGREERRRREERLREAVVVLDGFRRDLESRGGPPPKAGSAPPGGNGNSETSGADLEELIRSFEGEMVEPLRRDLEAADDFLVRLQDFAKGSGRGSLSLLEMGDIHAARATLEREDRKLADAERHARSVEAEARGAAEHCLSLRLRREAAARRAELARAEHAQAEVRPHATASLRAECRDRATRAYWTRPRRLEQLRKDLARYRETLEREESREKLCEAVRWAASHHLIQSVVLEGRPWYPRRPVLEKIENDLPAAIARLDAAMLELDRASVEAGLPKSAAEPPSLVPHVELLEERHRRAIAHERRMAAKIRLDGRLDELNTWRRIAGAAEEGVLETLLPGKTRGDALEALGSASQAARRAIEARTDLIRVEDEILGDIERLEPCLVGDPAVAAHLGSAPEPILLLARERARMEKDLDEAREALANRLEDAARASRVRVVEGSQPEVERRRGEFLESAAAAREGVAAAGAGPVDAVLRHLHALAIDAALGEVGQILDGKALGHTASRDPLQERLERARTEVASASIALEKAPSDPSLADLSRRRSEEVRRLEGEVEAAWTRAGGALAIAARLEPLLLERGEESLLARTAAGTPLESLGKDAARAVEEDLRPSDVLAEKLREAEDDLRRAGAEGSDVAAAERLFTDIGNHTPEEEEAALVAERIRFLEGEISRLRSAPAGAGASPAGAAAVTAPASDPASDDGTGPSGSPEAPRPSPDVLSPGRALDEAARRARAPGGAVFLAGKEIEAAGEDLTLARESLLPGLFASLGGNTSAPSVFQGGGFALVTLSLDRLKNPEIFEHEESQRVFLLEVADLAASLATLRRAASVAAAEIELARLRTGVDAILKGALPARSLGDAADPGRTWIEVEEARLRVLVATAEADLARSRRELAALLGRPAEEEISMGFTEPLPAPALRARIDAWLEDASRELAGRFPEHPAFRVSMASVRAQEAKLEEARLKAGGPVFRAGAGAAAPSEVIFTVGASIIQPLHDAAANAQGSLATSEIALERSGEDRRVELLGRRRDGARARRAGSPAESEQAERIFAAALSTLDASVLEETGGLGLSPGRIADDMGAARDALAASGGPLRSYLETGIDLVETGGLDGTTARASRPAPGASADDLRSARARLGVADAKLEAAEGFIQRVGIGASVSYSSILLPVPAVELSYGRSERARSAATAGLRREEIFLAHEASRRAKAGLDREIDARADAALVSVLERKVELRRRRLDVAAALEREGREAPLAVEWTRKQLVEAEAALETARARAAARAASSEPGTAAPASLPPGWTADTPGAIAPASAATVGISPESARTLLVAEEDHRFRALVAAIESKKPYGGNIGNFVSPLWDLFRLFARRPGTRAEIDAALVALRDRLLRPDPADAAAPGDTAFEKALEGAKDALGGDPYDPAEVGAAIRSWREAEVALRRHDREVARAIASARADHLSSLEVLEWLEGRAERAGAARARAQAAAALGRPDPLGVMLFEDDILGIEEARVEALRRDALARSALVELGGAIDIPSAAPPSGPRAVAPAELALIVSRRDPEVVRLETAIEARREEAAMVEAMGHLGASLPEVLPSLAVDPRFGGAGLTGGSSFFATLEPDQRASVVRGEVDALERELSVARLEAGLDAIEDALTLRGARERAGALAAEARRLEAEIAGLRARSDEDDRLAASIQEAEGLLRRTESSLESARLDEMEARARIDARAGEPLVLEGLDAAGGEPLEPTRAAVDEWVELARREDDAARAAGARAGGWGGSAEKRSHDSLLATRLEAIASLGQTPDNAEPGVGGFLAIPLPRILGLTRGLERKDAVRAEAFQGMEQRLEDEAALRLRSLALALEDRGSVLDAAEEELELARAAEDDDERAAAGTGKPVSPGRWLDSIESHRRAELEYDLVRIELERRLEELRGTGGVKIERRSRRKPRPAPRSPDDATRIAELLVRELSRLERGKAHELEDIEVRRRILAEYPPERPLRRAVEPRSRDLDAEREIILASSPRPGTRLRVEDIRIAEALGAETVAKLDGAMADLRRAKIEDSMARAWVLHQGDLRRELRDIALRPKYAKAVEALADGLRSSEKESPGILAAIEERFRSAQLAASMRIAERLPPERSGLDAEWIALRQGMAVRLPPEGRTELDGIDGKRSGLRHAERLAAASARELVEERDVLAAKERKASSAARASSSARLRADLEAASRSYLESPAGREALGGALEGFRAGRLAKLVERRDDIAARLAAARAAEPARRPLLAERSLEALPRAAGPAGLPGNVAAASARASSRIGDVRRASASARAGLVDVSGAAALDAAGSKERLARREALANSRTELEADWSALIEATDREGLLEPWRRETARMLGTDVSRSRKVEHEASRRIPIAVRILLGDDPDARARAAAALRARAPARLAKPPRGGSAEPPPLETVLRDVESASDLRARAREMVRLHAEPGKTADRTDLETLERTLRESAAREGLARSNARSYLEGFSRERPAAFLRWVMEGGIGAPSPGAGLVALRSAVKTAERDRDALRRVDLLSGEARDDLRIARSWKSAEAELDLVRGEVHDELDPPWLRPEGEAPRAGYADRRGRLLTLPEIAARDQHRIGKAIDALSEMEEARGLKKPVGLRETQDFIDLQVERSPLAAAPGARGGTGTSARARSFGDADTALARTQGLAAIAKLVLHETGWAEEGLEQAVEILRASRRSSEDERLGFRGVPRACTASAGEVEDDGVDLEGNALIAIACQRHAALSGSDELVPFAREIIERVLLPRARGDHGDGLAPGCPPGLAALTAAALRNQGQIERVLGSRQRARRFVDAAVSLEKAIAAAWDGDEGRFRGGSSARSDLWCLAVLSHSGGITPSMSRKAARALRDAEEIHAEMPERYMAIGSSKNWFVQGPLLAYERMVRPAAKGLGKDLPEVTDEDAWRLLNGALHEMTDGRLGFSIQVRGLAATRTDVGFEDTAHAAWVFGRLAASMEETAREGAPDEVRALAGDYGSALASSALSDPRNPLAMSWPYHPGKGELDVDPRRMRFDGELSTDAACHWVFSASVRRRIHPLFITDPRRLEAEAAEGEEGPAAGEIENEIADIEERLRALAGRLAAMEPGAPLPSTARSEGAAPVPDVIPGRVPSRLAATAAWLLRRVSPAGLVLTNDDPDHRNACHTYVCALAVIHLARAAVVEGDAELARAAVRIWSAMQAVRGADGSWADAYDGRTGAVYPGGWSRATGPNSWMALAGVHLHAATGDGKILEQAGETLRWLLSFQDSEEGNGSFGALTLDVVSYPKAISTEANADFIAAAAAYVAWTPREEEKATYKQAARRAADFVTRRLWIGKRFATGSEVPEGAPKSEDQWLDSQTWTYLALRASRSCHDHDPKLYEAGLSAMEDRITRVPWHGKVLVGFGKVTLGDDAFWAEGTAGYVLAARAAGMGKDEPRLIASLDAARLEDGSLPHIIGKAPSRDWKFDLRHAAVDGTVWAAWADPQVNFDPFEVKKDAAPVKSGARVEGARDGAEPGEEERLRKRIEGVEKSLEGMRGR